MLQSLLVSLLLVASFSSYSSEKLKNLDPKDFTITSVEISEFENDDQEITENFVETKNVLSDIGKVIEIVDGLIALGEKIYPIVEAGKPVLTSNLPVTHVIPNIPDSAPDFTFSAMENWQAPRSRSYKVVYKNVYGVEVISFTFAMNYQYGGSYDGAGKYLTGVFISAKNIHVSWGFEFSASTEIISLTNRGTKENPVAGLTLQLSWTAKTILSEIQSSKVIHVSGDGSIESAL